MKHSACPTGRKVRLKLRDGTAVVGTFVIRTRRKDVVLLVDGRERSFERKRIESFAVIRHELERKEAS